LEGSPARSASEPLSASAADAPVFLCGCVSVSQTKSSGASVCVTSRLGRASNSRILFTSPGWMIFFQLLTNGERLSSSNARCSAAATRRLTTSTFVTTSVFGYCAPPVRLLGEVQSLLVFELVALEDRAPSAGQRGPHQPVVREPVVQEGHERLPPRVIGVYVGRVRHRERGRQRGERARVSVRVANDGTGRVNVRSEKTVNEARSRFRECRGRERARACCRYERSRGGMVFSSPICRARYRYYSAPASISISCDAARNASSSASFRFRRYAASTRVSAGRSRPAPPPGGERTAAGGHRRRRQTRVVGIGVAVPAPPPRVRRPRPPPAPSPASRATHRAN